MPQSQQKDEPLFEVGELVFYYDFPIRVLGFSRFGFGDWFYTLGEVVGDDVRIYHENAAEVFMKKPDQENIIDLRF